MAGNNKPFDQATDINSTKTLLREAIPITGSIVSGTYTEPPDGTGVDSSVKNYNHKMFQSVYDYPYASSSANHLFDIAAGYGASSSLDQTTGETDGAKKNNVYNEMAQYLVGFDKDGNIERFDKDGDLTGGAKIDEVIVLNFARLLSKDGIQKGTFELEMGVTGAVAGWSTPFNQRIKIKDLNGTSSYKVNSPKGEYGILYANNSQGLPLNRDGFFNTTTSKNAPCGLLYYQPGIVILSASMFMPSTVGGLMSGAGAVAVDEGTQNAVIWSHDAAYSRNIKMTMHSGNFSSSHDGMRRRISNLSFNNTTILNSTTYLCKAYDRDFNYSSNPTYLDGSKIIVKNDDASESTNPRTFITTIGLYSAQDQLLAVAKLSKPIEKDSSNSVFFKVRLDY